MIVSGAGTGAADGTYSESDTFNGRSYYVLGSGSGRGVIAFTGLGWVIGTDTGTTGVLVSYYYNNNFEDVATPDLSASWLTEEGDSPAPTVTSGGAVAPTVTTQAVSSIGTTTATGNGNVTSDGGATVTERGVVAHTSTNPTTSNLKFQAASGGTGSYTASMTSLTPGTFYYVRAYAINSAGTSYGSNETFTTNSAGGATSTGFMSFFR